MSYLLDTYVEIAKDLKEKGALDVNDDKKMNEIYDRIADVFIPIFGQNNRVQITGLIQKRFESELLND